MRVAAERPWTLATAGSLWIASGRVPGGGTFTDWLLVCLPWRMCGTGPDLVFHALDQAAATTVTAGDVDSAREVFLVYADSPTTAVRSDDQDTIDEHLHGRGLA